MIQYTDKHDKVRCLHGQHGQPVQSEYSNHMLHVQCTKNGIHNFKLRKMSSEKIVDEICEISFDFFEEFCQGEMNCFIICTIDGQNNLVEIKLITERNEQLFLNSNFYIRSEADTDLFANFLTQIRTLF